MQCPNCRKIEKGQWLYANGCRSFPDFSMDDWTHEEDLYDLSYSEMVSDYLSSIGMCIVMCVDRNSRSLGYQVKKKTKLNEPGSDICDENASFRFETCSSTSP